MAPPPNAPDPVISAIGVVKRWGTTTALDSATLTIGRGVTGLLGANGAGKTTLLGLVLGLHAPDLGTLRVLGVDPSELGPEVRARLGYSPEHHRLPEDTKAYDLVAHMAEIHGLPHREATARASDALYLVGLGEERFRPVGTLSTGQRQRVKLAAAVAHDPELLLLDEPTDGLDPVQREDMLRLIRRIGTEFGIDVVLSSHNLDEVERVCDGAVILDEGRVVAHGTLDELRGTSQTTLVVDVAEGAGGLADLLRSRTTAEVDVDGLRLVVRGLVSTDAIRDACADLEVPLVRLARQRLSLEDVFLEASRP